MPSNHDSVAQRRQPKATINWAAAGAGLEIVSGKWVLAVMAQLAEGPKRHNELSRAVRLDHKRLGRVLRRAQEARIVTRETDPSRQQVHVWYELTRWGRDLLPILGALGAWRQDSQG